MPTVEVSYTDLLSLIGEHIPLDVLMEEAILYAKGEIDETDGEMLKIDIKDTNRPDLWSAEGIAREIKFRLWQGKLPKYPVKKSGRKIIVSPDMKKVRPLIAATIIKNIKVTEDLLIQMIHLQDKIDETFGRKRKEVAIGIYDYDRVKGDIKYYAADPDKTKFIPLDFTKELTLNEILKKHPKGKAYAHLVKNYPKYPLLSDSAGNVLSLPPIINSNYSGKVKSTTKNLIVEVTGYDWKYVKTANNVMVAALADRGGEIESVEVIFPDKKITTPDLKHKKTSLNLDFFRKLSGLQFKNEEIYRFLEKSGYEIKSKGKKVELLYPAYRQDIMHQSDVVEDIIITYGYNKIKPVAPKLVTIGSSSQIEKFSDSVTEAMIGLGFQEILSYILTNKNNMFKRMNAPEENVVEIENIVSLNWCVFRRWLLPSVLEFLSKNKHREYPQKIFEIGDVVTLDPKRETKTRDIRKLAVAVSDNRVGYEYVASVLDALLSSLGIEYDLVKTQHPSFIPGRTGEIKSGSGSLGTIGEIHPLVLNNWGIEKPVVAFEVDLEKLKKLI